MFDLVIFDCDGVLIDSEIISAQMLIDALAERGVQIDLAYVARHFLGRSYPTVMNTIREQFNLTLPPDFEEEYRVASDLGDIRLTIRRFGHQRNTIWCAHKNRVQRKSDGGGFSPTSSADPYSNGM